MSVVKKILGLLWVAIGLWAVYFLLIDQAIPKFKTGKPEDMIPAIIYTFILVPIIFGGLATFGYYSFTGEYDEI